MTDAEQAVAAKAQALSERLQRNFAELAHVRALGFNEAAIFSGVDPKQLRNGLDRGIFSVGEKHRSGRWMFSLKDCFSLIIVGELTRRAWMPVSVAAEAARRIAPFFDDIVTEMFSAIDVKGSGAQISDFAIWQEAGEVKVMRGVRTSTGRGSFYTLDGEEVAGIGRMHDAHVQITPVALIGRLGEAAQLVKDEKRGE